MSPHDVLRGSYTALGYRAASVERNNPVAGTQPGTSGDYHLRADRRSLLGIAERLQRDSGIYQGIVARFLDAVLGPSGFTLDVTTGRPSLDKRIRSDWLAFCEAPEVRGMFSWQDCERLSLRTVVNQGDVGAVLTNRKLFQFVEGEEIHGGSASPGTRLEQGVELDRSGAPLGYWVCPRSDSGMVNPAQATRFSADEFVFCPNLERYSQTRGVPILQASYAMIHRLTDVCDSEAIAWQTLSKFALAVTRERSPELAYSETVADNDSRSATVDGQLAERYAELDEAMIFFAKPGDSVQPISRSLPGKDFPESVRMFLRLIGLPFGLPLEVILLDYSQTNYSSSRATLEQAYRMFVAWQGWLKRRHHTPLYKAWLRWQIADGKYPDQPYVYSHNWVAPEFPWVDHLKESEAWGMRLDRGLATQAMALRSINVDYDDWAARREVEVRQAMERAASITKDTGQHCPWELFAAVPFSKSRGSEPTDGAEPAPQSDTVTP